jgi:RNA polymerase sigma factor (sigma-70 family)
LQSWRETLAEGDVASAWNQFIATHQKLIVATIRRTLGDDDDCADVFSEVCANLSSNGLARLASHTPSSNAKFSTWLVTVVHRQAIDWVRKRDGRHRIRPPPNLTPLQQEIFRHVFDEHRTHVEAYELARQSNVALDLSFGEFLREVTATYQIVEHSRGRTAMRYFIGPPSVGDQDEATVEDELAHAEAAGRLAAALATLPPDERLAVHLFVIHELGAEHVARVVGWPNAKSVYNRVYRALATLRAELDRTGFERTPP